MSINAVSDSNNKADISFASPSAKTDLKALLIAQQQGYRNETMPAAVLRIERLKRLKRMLLDNKEVLMAAMAEDFSARSRNEMLLAEFMSVANLIDYMCKRVKLWMKPEKRHLSLMMQPGRAQVFYQPLGVVGNMVPFNYPIQLACSPLATAMAAGNRCMIKMPEATPRTSALFERLIAETFSADLVAVVNGGPDVAAEFSSLPFDHLIFTGAGSIGKHVMRAAADNLTPVTLELGGKSPVIIDRDFPLQEAAERICYGKSLNAGQTCVAPDYVMVPHDKLEAFADAYKAAFNRFYPSINSNPDYTAVVSEHHQQRLQAWLDDARDMGAQVMPLSDEQIEDGSRRTVPVLVTQTQESMSIIREEIFGPALILLPYDDLDQAMAYINERERPLALYYFGFDKKRQRSVLENTHSGGVVFNEVVFHVAVDDLPFGGIGPSGMGHYHGKEGFLALSKPKAVLYKPRFNGMRMMYPPYNNALPNKIISWLLR
jgi:coniferyl-aldehyde dehydrogenase